MFLVQILLCIWCKYSEYKVKEELIEIKKQNDLVLSARVELLDSIKEKIISPLTQINTEEAQVIQNKLQELIDIEDVKFKSTEKSKINLKNLVINTLKLIPDNSKIDNQVKYDFNIYGNESQLTKLLTILLSSSEKLTITCDFIKHKIHLLINSDETILLQETDLIKEIANQHKINFEVLENKNIKLVFSQF